MRYMIIVKVDEPSPPPSSELLAEMGRFNQELVEAGIMLGGEGLMPSSSGAQVEKKGGRVVIKDGPFTEAKELVGGFWIIKADSLAEALEWAKKVPMGEGDKLEVRRVSEVEDFTDDAVSHAALERERIFRETGKWPEQR